MSMAAERFEGLKKPILEVQEYLRLLPRRFVDDGIMLGREEGAAMGDLSDVERAAEKV